MSPAALLMTQPTTDAEDLLAWSQRHDEAAFTRLVERHGGLVEAACRRRLGRSSAADDAVQATFLILARRAGAIREPAHLGPWLYGVALRVCRSSLRTSARRIHHEQAGAVVQHDQLPVDTWGELSRHLDAALASLSAPQRDAVVHHLLQGQSQAAVARQFGVSEEAIRKRVDYALGKLRSWFAKRGLDAGTGLLLAGLASEAHAIEPSSVEDCMQAVRCPTGSASALASAVEGIPLKMLLITATLLCVVAAGAWGLWRYGTASSSPDTGIPLNSAFHTPSGEDRPPCDFRQLLAELVEAEAMAHPLTTLAHAQAASDPTAGLRGPVSLAIEGSVAQPQLDDPVGITSHLGVHWRTMSPHLRIGLDGNAGAEKATILLTGTAATSPTSLIALLSENNRAHILPGRALRRQDRRTIPPRRDDEWARLSIACDPDKGHRLSSLLLDLDPVVSRSALAHHPTVSLIVRLLKLPGFGQFADAWSGDLTTIITPGPDRPGMSIVAGLRKYVAPEVLVSTLSGICDLASAPLPDGATAAWKTTVLDRTWTVLLAPHRMVLTTAGDPQSLLANCAMLPETDAHLTLDVDFPKIAAEAARNHEQLQSLARLLACSRLPIKIAEMGLESKSVADWLSLDGRHRPAHTLRLAPWSVTWTATSDGCSVRETGPLILSTCVAACAATLARIDAKEVTRKARDRMAIAAAWTRHRGSIGSLGDVGAYALADQPWPLSVREGVRPWFQGKMPTDTQLESFGRRYGRHGPTHTVIRDVHAPTVLTGIIIDETTGPLSWSVPLMDGWSVGIIGNTYGLVRVSRTATRP